MSYKYKVYFTKKPRPSGIPQGVIVTSYTVTLPRKGDYLDFNGYLFKVKRAVFPVRHAYPDDPDIIPMVVLK